MEQYHNLLRQILLVGTHKPAARKNMPGTISLFGHQMRFDFNDGFPILTTKKIKFEHIVAELLWFLRGDSNIKFMVDNNCNIWNQDAYNYYVKLYKEVTGFDTALSLDRFIDHIKKGELDGSSLAGPKYNLGYRLGDTGHSYPVEWRKWDGISRDVVSLTMPDTPEGIEDLRKKWQRALKESTGCAIVTDKKYRQPQFKPTTIHKRVDQISNVLSKLFNSPEGRRIIITPINPVYENDVALYWCHGPVQFNCRPMTATQRTRFFPEDEVTFETDKEIHDIANERGYPKYFLDCHFYQRSADVFLGVPYNISSYGLLTCLFAKMTNMVPGTLIHSFGDVHIYDDHRDVVDEILTRNPAKYALPKLTFSDNIQSLINENVYKVDSDSLDQFFNRVSIDDFALDSYQSYPRLKAKLSTGLNA